MTAREAEPCGTCNGTGKLAAVTPSRLGPSRCRTCNGTGEAGGGTLRRVWYVSGRERGGARRVIDAGPFRSEAEARAYVKAERLAGAVVSPVERPQAEGGRP